jgi:hypothetical protein
VLHHEECSLDVGVDRCVNVAGGPRRHGANGAFDAGIVEHGVHPTEDAERFVDQRGNQLFVAHVGADEAYLCPRLSELVDEARAPLAVAPCEHNGLSWCGQLLGRGGSDADARG